MTKQKTRRPVGNHIRAWREHRGFSMRTLAKETGLAYSTIGGLESGHSMYSQQSLEAISKALNVASWQLLKGPPELPDLVNGSMAMQTKVEAPAKQVIADTNVTLEAWQMMLDGQHNVTFTLLTNEINRAVERAVRDAKKRMAKYVKSPDA
jgi:transcriptional regulator with XRE-family HTH domain